MQITNKRMGTDNRKKKNQTIKDAVPTRRFINYLSTAKYTGRSQRLVVSDVVSGNVKTRVKSYELYNIVMYTCSISLNRRNGRNNDEPPSEGARD